MKTCTETREADTILTRFEAFLQPFFRVYERLRQFIPGFGVHFKRGAEKTQVCAISVFSSSKRYAFIKFQRSCVLAPLLQPFHTKSVPNSLGITTEYEVLEFTQPESGPVATPTSQVSVPQRDLEDPLAHLPCSTILAFKKGQVIYNQDQPSNNLYLVIAGKVKVSRLAEDGRQVVVDIYQPDEFFGESAFLSLSRRSEISVALENVKVMTWTTNDIEDILMRRPKLAIALMQLLVQRSMDFGHRIESFSVDNIARRLARTLIRFSERLGSPSDDGSVQMIPFTHELLSQYVGTSREIVTHYMNHFRRQGYLRYSRKGIMLYRDAMKDWLRQAAA